MQHIILINDDDSKVNDINTTNQQTIRNNHFTSCHMLSLHSNDTRSDV